MSVLIEGREPLMVVSLAPYLDGVVIEGRDARGEKHPLLVIDGDGVLHWPQSISESTGWQIEDEHIYLSSERAAIG